MAQRVDRFELAKKWAIEAGKSLSKHKIKHELKPDKSIVTSEDLRLDKMIKKNINKYFPDDQIISEESEKEIGTSEYSWILDPIDGTANFFRGIPHFNVSIAVLKNGKGYCSAVYDPSNNRLFSALKDKGAFMDGKKLKVSAKKEIENSTVIICRSHHAWSKILAVNLFGKLSKHTMTPRVMGSSALDVSYVGAGIADACVVFGLEQWDTAGGELIVLEADGIIGSKDRVKIYASTMELAKAIAKLV